jgi:SOS response regulatory protein OraA/RecX/outer membrane protein OmpA-like peptidoglycan-associated protein
MGVITSIRRNVKNAGRCSVFVDDVFFAACPIDVALALGLRKGLEMSSEIEQRLRREDRRMVLRQKAYRFATYKPRTERDVVRFLVKAEATDEESSDVLKWLREFRLIDDVSYAERFIEASKQRKPLSPSMMRRTLLGKGLSESIVEAAMAASVDGNDVTAAARAVARKKLRMIASDNARHVEDKLVRFLQYRGYGWDVIKQIVTEWKRGELIVLTVMLFMIQVVVARSQADTTCKKMRLSETINAYQPTTQPFVDDDGRLVFDRKFHPDNLDGGSNDPDQPWVSRWRNGRWDVPTPLSFDVVDAATGRRISADVVFGLSRDKMRALLAGRFVPNSSAMALALAHRSTAEGPFVSYQIIIADLGKNFYATATDDGSVIIVALQRPDGRGDLDLYRVTNDGCGRVGQPQNIGSLNTAAFDGAPWIACDGKTLYFASAGREDRRGKADIYVTRRLDDSWLAWTTPVNLGPCVNSTEDETAVSVACGSTTMFFTSWDPETDRAGVYTAELDPVNRPSATITLRATVVDAVADSSVRGLQVLALSSTTDSCPAMRGWPTDRRSGRAALIVPANSTITLSIQPTLQWRALEQSVETGNTDRDVRVRVISLTKPLCSITFAHGDSILSPEGHATLESLRSRFGTSVFEQLRVVGWADASGSDETNMRISRARARVVAEQATILVKGGELHRIDYRGGGVEAVNGRRVANDAPQSRRVDVYLAP